MMSPPFTDHEPALVYGEMPSLKKMFPKLLPLVFSAAACRSFGRLPYQGTTNS